MKIKPDNLEIEVKFFLADPQAMHQRLLKLSATARPEVFETNLRFEDSGHTLEKGGKLLRLRRDEVCRLTYKCPAHHEDTDCKVLKELEVVVSDFDTMAGILKALGYHPVQIYEKRRRIFDWRDIEFCLDIMPFGAFLEIEGPGDSIKDAARRLDLAWGDRILANYLAIFNMLRTRFELPFNDVTFARFQNHPVDIGPLLPSLQAGGKQQCR